MKRKQIILIFTIISKKMLTSSRYVKFKTIFAPSVSKDLINTLCSIIYHILFSKHIPIRKHWRQTHLCWKRQKFAHIFDVNTRIISNIATQDIKIAIACFSCREMLSGNASIMDLLILLKHAKSCSGQHKYAELGFLAT